MQNNLEFLDLLTVMSFLVSLINLSLNERQVSSLDEHLQKQDSILVEEQNRMLQKIIEQNEEIIKLIKEEYHHAQENDKRSNR